MIAVSDTSPICYLILTGDIDILPKLFGQVLVPQAVLAELSHGHAPEAVRDWTANPPTWITVQEDPPDAAAGVLIGLENLQAGERAAILLAESASADVILLDEKSARRAAAARGLRVTGTLAVLGEASLRGLVDLTTAIDRLRKTNFRYSPALLKATLDRFSRPHL
jgi:predicted nucleic acid-binding protein